MSGAARSLIGEILAEIDGGSMTNTRSPFIAGSTDAAVKVVREASQGSV